MESMISIYSVLLVSSVFMAMGCLENRNMAISPDKQDGDVAHSAEFPFGMAMGYVSHITAEK